MDILIIEDEVLSAERLERLLVRLEPGARVVGQVASVRKGREWLAGGPALPELILADIQLTDGLSFELLRELPRAVPIIFCTAYDEYALQAFKFNGFDYLLKPIEEEALGETLARFRQRRAADQLPTPAALAALLDGWQAGQRYRSRLLVYVRDELRPVDAGDVAYFYLEHKLIHLVCRDGSKLIIEESLDALEASLDPRRFFRLTRQCLVSTAAIGKVHRHYEGRLSVQLGPVKQEVLVSRLTVPGFKQWLNS